MGGMTLPQYAGTDDEDSAMSEGDGEYADEAIQEEAKEAAAAMPEEPAENVEHLKVSFRMPDGKRLMRRFLPTDPVNRMLAVASATTGVAIGKIDISSQFPKRSLRDVDGGLT